MSDLDSRAREAVFALRDAWPKTLGAYPEIQEPMERMLVEFAQAWAHRAWEDGYLARTDYPNIGKANPYPAPKEEL